MIATYAVLLAIACVDTGDQTDFARRTPAPSTPSYFAIVPSWERDPSTDSHARAYVEAMRLHDLSIWSFEIEETCHAIEPDGTRTKMFEFQRGSDERGRMYETWTIWLSKAGGIIDDDTPDAGGEPETIKGALVSDGYVRKSYSVEERTGLIGQDDPRRLRLPALSIDRAMGRWISARQVEPLADLMLRPDSDLSLVRVDPESGRARVRAVVNTGSYIGEIVVDIDPHHGYCPSMIAVFDGYTLRPVEYVQLLEWQSVKGVWLPTSAVMQTFMGDDPSLDPSMAERFQARLSELRLPASGPDPNDAETRQNIRSIFREVFGASGMPVKPITNPQLWRTTKIISVNETIAAERLQPADVHSYRFSNEFEQIDIHGSKVAEPKEE